MKIFTGFLTEFVNFFTVLESKSIPDVVKDFVAFEIIMCIDNIIMTTVRTVDPIAELEKQANLVLPRPETIQ